MKNSLYLLPLAAFTLASCANEDTVEVSQGREISFRPAMSSRAAETTNANLEDFKASAFIGSDAYFNQVTFSRNGSFYTSAKDYLWPGDDTQIDFFAYAPSDLTGVTLTPDTKTLADFAPAAAIADQVDFISAQASGTRSANESAGVPLDFAHRLAQIEVRAKTSNDVYNFEVSGVRIGRPVSAGTFDFGTNEWTLASDKADYETTYATPVKLGEEAASVMGADGNAMLIPQQLTAWEPTTDGANTAEGAYLSIKLRITAAETGTQIYPFPSNGEDQWAAIPVNTNWEAGKKYIYTLDLTHGGGYVDPKNPDPGTPVLGGPIKFTVQVEDWTDTPVAPIDMKTSSED